MEVVEGVAACLKAANMKLGDQYLNKLKLCHVEKGFDLPPWLIRSLSLCKKALIRNKGPTKKAMEARLEDVSEDVWVKEGLHFENGINSATSYAWACIWMLREIEANESKWEHVTADEQKKVVSLHIPISKMDQSAKRVKKTLQCCGEPVCTRFCAWKLWKRITNEFSKKKITLLRVIPTMAFNSSHLTFCLANLLAFYLAYLLTFYLAILSGIPSGTSSDTLSGISSDILSGMSSDILSGTSSDILSGKSSDILSGILSGIPSGMSSDILPGISSDILSVISSDILSGISFMHSIWQIF